MRIDVLTLFPSMVEQACGHSIVARARSAGLLELVCTDIRQFAHDRHRSVDDRPFGGGPGMVMTPGPIFEAIDAVTAMHPALPIRILLTPQGRRFDQRTAESLARHERLMLIAGHYEGFDERVRLAGCDLELSIGDVVLSGGEVPALVVIDAVTPAAARGDRCGGRGPRRVVSVRRARTSRRCSSIRNTPARASFAGWRSRKC